MGALVELVGLVVIVGAVLGVLRSLGGAGRALGRSGGAPEHAAQRPSPWEPHVGAVDNHTVVSVRRAPARAGGRAEVLEIARFRADDPDWHDKLVTARAEASLRAAELNAPY